MSDTEYIQVTHRELPYTTFDADNHLYENRDALTKFLPREYEGAIKYVDINGRTKLAIRDRILRATTPMEPPKKKIQFL